jgi:hypothetical protein
MRDGHDDAPTTKLNLASSGSFVGETLYALGSGLIGICLIVGFIAAANIIKSG